MMGKKISIGYALGFSVAGLMVVWMIARVLTLGTVTRAILSETYGDTPGDEKMVDISERQARGPAHVPGRRGKGG